MKIGKTLYVTNRRDWRKWIEKNHDKKPDIWLVYYNKASSKPSIPYNDAVEEALCFGWIDSIIKKLEVDSRVQRFSPRKPRSYWSEMNKERVRRLIKQGRMTSTGLAVAPDVNEEFEIAADIISELKRDKETWDNFQKFPESYQRIRIGFIDMSRKRPEVFKQRLNYFLKMTKLGKKYGLVQ